MHAFSSDQFVLPLPAAHRFPMRKYALLRERVAAELSDVQLHEAPSATDAELATAHTQAYIDAVASGSLSAAQQREIGFPWSQAMAERARRSVGATLAACRAALGAQSSKVAANLAGGTHHAYADKGSGFCVFNDAAVATRVLQREAREHGDNLRVAIIDLDVHQGNGTASILRNDADVFTLSVHGEKNFPFRKERSHLDVDLPDGTRDADYLAALDEALHSLTCAIAPQLIIYLAGADPYEHDRLGRLKLTPGGLLARDARVFTLASTLGAAVAVTMAGGYCERIDETVQIQFNTLKLAARFAAGGAEAGLSWAGLDGGLAR
jgi:acetoin utilization deacetylase AcuC-like enzyme